MKIGIFEFCPRLPDLVISGINGGLNAGINVLYSGTVAAAVEGAFFGITSMAVSLEFDDHAEFDKAARLARGVIEQVLEKKSSAPQLYNLNIPTVALDAERPEVRMVPMGLSRRGEQYEKRVDPRGRSYFWALSDPVADEGGHETDVSALSKGFVTLTPLHFDLTQRPVLEAMEQWEIDLSGRNLVPAARTSARESSNETGNKRNCDGRGGMRVGLRRRKPRPRSRKRKQQLRRRHPPCPDPAGRR